MPIVKSLNGVLLPVSVQARGVVVIQMRWIKDKPPFEDAQKRSELLSRIQNIPELRITEAGMEGFPKFPISVLTDPRQLHSLTDALDWVVDEIRSSGAE
jgi:hypothetical protein